MFDLQTFTHVHVAISLAAILSGLVVLLGLLTGRRLDHWTSFFLLTTVATSVTGFFFPFHGFTPAIGVGIISLIVLAVAIVARYPRHLAGSWRVLYVIGATLALYLNVFVLIVQLFQNVPALESMAPTQSEPPFLVAQLAALILFVVLGILAAIRFHPAPVSVGLT
jgi:hypothetical protein